MENRKCKKCGKELKSNKGFLCGNCKSGIIDGGVKVAGVAFATILGIVTKGKFKGKS